MGLRRVGGTLIVIELSFAFRTIISISPNERPDYRCNIFIKIYGLAFAALPVPI